MLFLCHSYYMYIRPRARFGSFRGWISGGWGFKQINSLLKWISLVCARMGNSSPKIKRHLGWREYKVWKHFACFLLFHIDLTNWISSMFVHLVDIYKQGTYFLSVKLCMVIKLKKTIVKHRTYSTCKLWNTTYLVKFFALTDEDGTKVAYQILGRQRQKNK